MTIKVVNYSSAKSRYRVRISQGVQSFWLADAGSKKNCEWFAKQFKTALTAHDLKKFQIKKPS